MLRKLLIKFRDWNIIKQIINEKLKNKNIERELCSNKGKIFYDLFIHGNTTGQIIYNIFTDGNNAN